MMLLNLIKKDCLIIKKYLILMLGIALIIPLFMYWRMPSLLGFCTLLLSTIIVELMLTQSVSLVETKYPKATALLCSAPYPRQLLVVGKYIFTLFIFAYCCIVYSIEACLVPNMKQISVLDIMIAYLVVATIYGIYSPFQYKYGYEKTKYFFVIVIMVTPFILPAVIKHIPAFDLKYLSLSTLAFSIALFIISTIISLISLKASINIFRTKEL